ncbi:transposase [Aneurinibacillus uraniidurans]|uniref:transposase n=1 Tax=Aneurinibacillus uraniidurans TaxID=2966586 RepID=UPI003BEEFF1B
MRNSYSLTFKRQVIQRVLETRDANKVARENGINTFMIYRWLKEYRKGKYQEFSI